MRRSVSCALVIITIIFVFPFICGCSDDSDASNPFTELLEMVPSDVDVSQAPVVILDYASFYEDYNISLTGDDGQTFTFQEFTNLLLEKELGPLHMQTGADNFITGGGRYAFSSTIEDKYVGYNFTDVDAEIQAGAPPHQITAAIGRFDAQATRDALSRQDEWPDWAVEAYTVEEYNGVTIHSWGDGYEVHLDSILSPPHIDHLGRARPLAVTDELLFYSPSLETVKAMIDAGRGEAESLADLPEYAEVADALYEHGAYSMYLASEALVNNSMQNKGAFSGSRLKKFVTCGVTHGQDEDGVYLMLAIYHENKGDAKDNVSLLEERIEGTDSVLYEAPWSELITGADISADGKLLVAKLYMVPSWTGGSLLYDFLLLNEESTPGGIIDQSS